MRAVIDGNTEARERACLPGPAPALLGRPGWPATPAGCAHPAGPCRGRYHTDRQPAGAELVYMLLIVVAPRAGAAVRAGRWGQGLRRMAAAPPTPGAARAAAPPPLVRASSAAPSRAGPGLDHCACRESRPRLWPAELLSQPPGREDHRSCACGWSS